MTSYSQVAVGIYGAFDNSKFSGDIQQGYTYQKKNGFAAGLTFDFSIAEKMFVSLRPNFTRNGSEIGKEINFDSLAAPFIGGPPDDSLFLFPITNDYVSLPVVVQVYVSRAFYANAGLDFSYNLSSEAQVLDDEFDISDRINPLEISALFGFGFSIPFKSTSLNLEMTYAQGLNTLTKKSAIEAGTAPRIRTRRFRFAAYFIVFTSKKKL